MIDLNITHSLASTIRSQDEGEGREERDHLFFFLIGSEAADALNTHLLNLRHLDGIGTLTHLQKKR